MPPKQLKLGLCNFHRILRFVLSKFPRISKSHDGTKARAMCSVEYKMGKFFVMLVFDKTRRGGPSGKKAFPCKLLSFAGWTND